MASAQTPSRVDAVVVGAGIAGLYALHRLRGDGYDVQVLEAGDGVGGTWYWNRYPGARCDAESLFYSYSFSPDLDKGWEWSEKYPAQEEILRYLEHVADRFDLRRDIRLRTRVSAAHYDSGERRWTVTTDQGDAVSARFVVMATGCLSMPKVPDIAGSEDFEGPVYVTGRWPHEGVDFTGRRVAVIGTGSSGVQAIPVIAEQAPQLTVFQRTPNFSTPAFNGPLAAQDRAAFRAAADEIRAAGRASGFGIPREEATVSALEVDADERERVYQAAYDEGNLVAVLLSFNDLLTDVEANDTAAEFVRRRIRATVRDPEVAEALCPSNHPYGSKRPCLDSGYFETFNREHVTLVDLRRTPIERITAKGVRTTDREREFDDIVFATGFDAMTGALAAVDIRGEGGEALSDRWAHGPSTYLGLAVAGFPNLFMITGPGSPSVLSNVMVSIEQHVEWLAGLLAHMRETGAEVAQATPQAEAEWTAHVAEVGTETLYPRADSWYMGANVPGKPRVLMPYAGGVGAYRELCDQIAADGYRGFEFTRSREPVTATG